MSSQTILAILSPEDDDSDVHDMPPNLFHKLSLLRSVAQKVQQSVLSDKPAIGRPAREAREYLKALDNESLHGLF
jgi:hypothetical protein